ncbi:MAG: flagellar hook-associated protein 3 [Lachnospiraceae bacterium]|nr:flagellar hook-associated protein 3 [Lachnospiraceae bacterium]
MALRVTNNMIMKSANTNINGTKVHVDKTNNQMTTQQKISRPSEDPVIAVRSLRLQTSLSKIDQYYEKNIPDADKWMDVTGTALTNMASLISDMRTLAVQGANGPNTQDDRNTILSQLRALQEQIYHEGDADYAGRTVFTGFHTNKTLTFQADEPDTNYEIKERLSFENMEEFRYFAGETDISEIEKDLAGTATTIPDIQETKFQRLRLSYDKISDIQSISIINKGAYETDRTNIALSTETPAAEGTPRSVTPVDTGTVSGGTYSGITSVKVYPSEKEWEAASTKDPKEKSVEDNEIVVIRETGELIFGKTIAADIQSGKASIDVTYDKKGFDKGELRPEYYHDSVDYTDPSFGKEITYDKFEEKIVNDGTGDKKTVSKKNYDINYTIATNQEIAVNLEADSVFDTRIMQDIKDMTDAVTDAINAHDRVTKIKSMMSEGRYADDDSQEKLSKWLKEAEKEASYADDHLDKWFSTVLGHCDTYEGEINLANTRLGCKQDQLVMVEKRMSEQQETVMELQSENDNLDLSDIILKYTAAYTAYQSSLTAAGRLGQQTLLNYI